MSSSLCYICNLYGLRCISTSYILYISVSETLTLDAAFLIDNWGNSDTRLSTWFLSISRFAQIFSTLETYMLLCFSKLEKIFEKIVELRIWSYFTDHKRKKEYALKIKYRKMLYRWFNHQEECLKKWIADIFYTSIT